MDAQTITNLLRDVRNGTPHAADQLMGAVYHDLHGIAARAMAGERFDHTLQPTALVNEAYLRLEKQLPDVTWQDRAHFYGVAARQMRQILVDHSRRYRAEKRGNGLKVALNEEVHGVPRAEHSFEDIDILLKELEQRDPQAAQVVELKFFGGLTDDEVAEVLRTNRTRVRRDWEFARTWLFQQLKKKV
jgi:RNA polymerase sigma factor (TIGR02999 family)